MLQILACKIVGFYATIYIIFDLNFAFYFSVFLDFHK